MPRVAASTFAIALEHFAVSIGESDLTARSFHVQSVLVSGLDVHVRRHRDGTLNLEHLAPEAAPETLLTHDAHAADPSYAFALSRLTGSDLAHTVTGVFRAVQRPTYDDQARAQVEEAKAAKPADLQGLLRGNDTWTVAG